MKFTLRMALGDLRSWGWLFRVEVSHLVQFKIWLVVAHVHVMR